MAISNRYYNEVSDLSEPHLTYCNITMTYGRG